MSQIKLLSRKYVWIDFPRKEPESNSDDTLSYMKVASCCTVMVLHLIAGKSCSSSSGVFKYNKNPVVGGSANESK